MEFVHHSGVSSKYTAIKVNQWIGLREANILIGMHVVSCLAGLSREFPGRHVWHSLRSDHAGYHYVRHQQPLKISRTYRPNKYTPAGKGFAAKDTRIRLQAGVCGEQPGLAAARIWSERTQDEV